jgi:hypothetical protein
VPGGTRPGPRPRCRALAAAASESRRRVPQCNHCDHCDPAHGAEHWRHPGGGCRNAIMIQQARRHGARVQPGAARRSRSTAAAPGRAGPGFKFLVPDRRDWLCHWHHDDGPGPARGQPGSLASDGPVPWLLVPGPVAGVERLRADREVAPTRSVDAAMQFDRDNSFWLVEEAVKTLNLLKGC